LHELSMASGILETVLEVASKNNAKKVLEVVVEGETGHLVPFEADPVTSFPQHPETFSRALAEKISALLADPAKAKAFGAAGRRRVEQHFSWTSIAHQTIALYQQLIAARG